MLSAWLRKAFRSRYVRLLEEEVERLRGENRALLNSLLGTAGFPPVDLPEAKPLANTTPRMRRRSWPQIAARREIEEARKGLKAQG